MVDEPRLLMTRWPRLVLWFILLRDVVVPLRLTTEPMLLRSLVATWPSADSSAVGLLAAWGFGPLLSHKKASTKSREA
ncbi:hypothetical protein [Adonisia turfae]|uniref:Uncharacterized protein n=1 Tax=Adonisia turfae CCMR0081 TaxID=2292702 RepID=A0A6M0RTR5_9CYAN|nr:hypothetical protein [Adonisia turfae]NEZ59654.1 hypothetical protein [Adonisia turfae CCMR0081]